MSLIRRAVSAFVLLAAGIVFAAGLSGCSGDGQQGAASHAAGSQPEVTLEVYAANSLSGAMDEAQEAYVEQHPEVAFADAQYEASGTLLEKIKAGAQPDIFISASKAYMDQAEQAQIVAQDAPFDLFENDLVIVAPADSPLNEVTLEQAASGAYSLAVGDENVPAGTYAKQALHTVGGYSDPSGTGGSFTGPVAGKVVLADKAGSVCAYVDSGDVDLGFVYSSDVMRYGNVKVVCVVPLGTHQPIVYPASVTQASSNQQAAQDFLAWCQEDPEAVKIWQKWGFQLAATNG